MGKIKRVLFLGSKQIALKSLSTIYDLDKSSLIGIITIDDKNDERNVFEGIHRFSKDRNIDFHVVKSKQESEDLITKFKPDLCIVVGWYWFISKKILDSVPYGFLGIHGSLLPKYRGGSPLVWAIINGEKQVGFSIFSFSSGIDNGPLWGQKKIEISNNEYIAEILTRVEDEIVVFLKEKYPLILSGSIKPIHQNENDATYCSQRIPEDGKIDWSQSSVNIFNFIRAQSKPYPGAFTFWNNCKITIWDASPVDCVYYGSPGQIARISSDGVYVICGDHRPLILHEIQIGDNLPVKSTEVLRSIKIRFT